MNENCVETRRDILKIAIESGHGHIPTCFSVVECLYAVYEAMSHDPKDPQWAERDYFILSKGHASLAHYCVLARLGYIPIDDIYAFGSFESLYGCHADRHKVMGIEASTGSLGHGIGLAVGKALGIKIDGRPQQVYTLIGDGESNEGTVWEAMMVADNLKLNNLTVIYDDNRSHSRGLQIQNPAEKFRSFGAHVTEVDGHDLTALGKAFEEGRGKLSVVVAKTKKGYGCKTLENDTYAWHRRSPTPEEYTQLMEELA